MIKTAKSITKSDVLHRKFTGITIETNLAGWRFEISFDDGTSKRGCEPTFEAARLTVDRIINPLKPVLVECGDVR
jgi:hypothetical protein